MNTFLIEAEEERIGLTIETGEHTLYVTVNDRITLCIDALDHGVRVQAYPIGGEADDYLSESFTSYQDASPQINPF